MLRSLILAALLVGVAAGHAGAHTGAGAADGIAHGFAHPLLGLDHLLAMLAVGLWAGGMGGRAVWLVPAAFVGTMALGGVLGMAGLPLPLVELGIAGSVLVLGFLVALAPAVPVWASCLLVGIFALFHGHAHGTEMPADTGALGYAAGFLVATAILHALGVAFALSLRSALAGRAVRWAGALIGLGGVVLVAS